MLNVFRRYERFIYICITIVIILSFSFFGTYSTLQQSQSRDYPAFTAIDGTQISHSETEEMVRFLGTDAEDKLMFAGIWGPNFLNDGVLKKDFFENGLAEILAQNYASDLEKDLKNKHEREKAYKPYENPQAPFISVTNIWDHFIPEMHEDFLTLQKTVNPASNQALSARIRLFMASRNLPPYLLRQVIKYQEKQYSWISPDSKLDSLDLSLFGYHTIEDWFGGNFLHIAAQYIINSAKIAEKKGFVVTKDEALADLQRNSELSFRANYKNTNLGVSNSTEYFEEQLRRMGLDKAKAIKIWQNVLLFRRLFPDTGNGTIVDASLFQNFQNYAKETLQGELYQLPEELRFGNFRSLQQFETYLAAISTNNSSDLSLPNNYLPLEQIEKQTPELIQKRYLLEIASVTKKKLQDKIGLKQTWDWEMQPENWNQLKKEFPEIGNAKAETVDEKINILDKLESKTRSRIDNFARQAIVDTHPEWIKEELQNAELKKQVVGIRKKGKNIFVGLKDPSELTLLLDQAPQSNDRLSQFTADNNTFYRINVLERTSHPEILTFAEAQKDGTLDELLNKKLVKYYEENKNLFPELYQKENKIWMTFEEAKHKVAEQYFDKLLKAIQKDYLAATHDESATHLIPDVASSLRLFAYMRNIKEKFTSNQDQKSEWLRSETLDNISTEKQLSEQWKLIQTSLKTNRTQDNNSWKDKIFSLNIGDWSKVATPTNGDLKFFKLIEKTIPVDLEATSEMVYQAQRLLSNEAQRAQGMNILKEIQKQKAISLDYLKRNLSQE